MKKSLALILALVLTVALFVGCGKDETMEDSASSSQSGEDGSADAQSVDNEDTSTETPTEPTELTLVFADGDAKAKETNYQIVDNFNASQEKYIIKIEPGNGGAYNEFLKTKESVGEFPDIVEMRDVGQYVRADMIAPLSEVVEDLFVTTIEISGDVYVAPFAAEIPQGMMYNKQYFEENGLNESPQNWDEFIQLCQQIEELGDMSPIVVGGNDLWHMGFWFNKVYQDRLMTEDEDFIANMYAGDKTWGSTPETTETFETLKELFKYVDEGWGSTPDAMITTFLVSDMAAMMYSGTWMFTQIEEADPDFEFGWFAIPDDEGRINMIGGAGAGGWALSKEAAEKGPEYQDAFDEFMKFYYSPEQYGLLTSALSLIPVTKEDPIMKVGSTLEKVIEASKNANQLLPMWNNRIGYNELPPDYRNFTYKILVEVLQETRDIDSALKELDKTWKTSTQDFNPVTGVGIE